MTNVQMPQSGGPTLRVSTAKPVLLALGVWVATVFVSMVAFGSFLSLGIGLAIGAVIASFLASWVGVTIVQGEETISFQGAPPVAFTPEGKPIYQVVGYTTEGTPITADRAVGLRPVTSRTNTLAIVTLIVSLVFSPLAIPLGRIAMAQIERTGEQGRGLAIAGLVIGCIGVAAFSIFAIVATASSY